MIAENRRHNSAGEVRSSIQPRLLQAAGSPPGAPTSPVFGRTATNFAGSSWLGSTQRVQAGSARRIPKTAREIDPNPALIQARFTPLNTQFGGQPVGALIANYFYDPVPRHENAMQHVASVGQHVPRAPLFAAEVPSSFGLEAFTVLPDIKDLEKTHFEGRNILAKWQAFREKRDARICGPDG